MFPIFLQKNEDTLVRFAILDIFIPTSVARYTQSQKRVEKRLIDVMRNDELHLPANPNLSRRAHSKKFDRTDAKDA
jgi:hypothetical protein